MPSQDPRHRSYVGTPPRAYDRRVSDLVNRYLSEHLRGKSPQQPVNDSLHSLNSEMGQHDYRRPLQTGRIVHSLPFCNWYKVQPDGPTAAIPCCALAETSAGLLPIGPRPVSCLPAGSFVVVWLPPGQLWGIIMGSYTPPAAGPGGGLPDWVLQGSQAGIRREKAYTEPFTLLFKEGGVKDFSAAAPLDSTTLEWGRMTATGVGLGLDEWMTWLRASELAGLWFHYFDHHARLAAWNFDLQTAAHELVVRDDEGEPRLIELHNTYLHEALGLYAPGQPASATFDAKKVQTEIPRGARDLADDEEDLQPIARYQEFGGYLGQGRLRMVMVPAQDTGKRFYADDPRSTPDFGVFMESIGLDGSYALTSAHSISLRKHVLIPVPKEMRRPEDQKIGDDARKKNYRFAGFEGESSDAPEHKIASTPNAGTPDDAPLRRAAAVLDMVAFGLNWKPLHPFHYHEADYAVPQMSDLEHKSGVPSRAQDVLDFSALRGRSHMPGPTPARVRVDHRYGEVEYASRTAGIEFTPDGEFVIYSGSGVRITSAGGNLQVDLPGDVILNPGRSLVGIAGDDVILRARRSADLTAGTGDLRLKGEGNVQLLSNSGGVLIESFAPFAADFEDKVGEDVVSGGVVLKSKQGAVVAWGGEVLLRTGGTESGLSSGNITLDAGKGNGGRVLMAGATVTTYAASVFNVYIGPSGAGGSEVRSSFLLASNGGTLDGSLLVGGFMGITGDIVQDGSMFNRNGYASVNNNPDIGKGRADDLSRSLSSVSKTLDEVTSAGEESHQADFTDGIWADGRPGNDRLISMVGFSYRDVDDNSQYGTGNFRMLESYWTQMQRLGLGSGGQSWGAEPVVSYQGRQQLPYPGKAKWTDETTLLRLSNLTLYDAATGRPVDRPGPYAEPELADWDPVPPAEGMKSIEGS